MSSIVSRLWREPLLHFLLIGAALFVYYDLVGNNIEGPPKRIHVDRGQVQQLAANFERVWSRPPTADELEKLVDSYLREEVFYREALAMGLDKGDPMVRRRLRMKLEFMLEDLSAQDVDDAVLADYLQKNQAEYRIGTELSFVHVYLNPDRHPQLEADAATLLARLNDGADPDELGDPTLVPRSFELAPESEITRQLGEKFTRRIVSLPDGEWSGPIYSPFGAHLVRIDRRIEARLPVLDEIRDQVLRDYQADQRSMQKDLAYEKLRESYDITVDPLTDSAVSGNPIIPEARAGETQ